jgi:hypothetical protein
VRSPLALGFAQSQASEPSLQSVHLFYFPSIHNQTLLLVAAKLLPSRQKIIATAKVIRTFLIIETLDFIGFYLLPSALCLLPSAIPILLEMRLVSGS